MYKYLLLLLFIVPSVIFADVTQSNVTASRSFGTEYQNTSGYPMYVAISIYNSSATNDTRILCQNSSVSTTTHGAVAVASVRPYTDPSTQNFDTCTFLVPNGWYYKGVNDVGTAVLYRWIEWVAPETSGSGSTSTTQVVDNPALNVFGGVILFLAFMWFIVWFFAKKR